MFYGLGYVISILTFPGVVVHEIAHLFFCRVAKLKVYGYCLLRMGNPMGYVLHESPRKLKDALLITSAPVFINSIAAFLVAFFFRYVSFNATYRLGIPLLGTLVMYFGVWLTVSLGVHAFPSLGDAKSLLGQVKSGAHGAFGKLFGYPVAGFIMMGSVLAFFWIDVLYGFYIFRAAAWTLDVGIASVSPSAAVFHGISILISAAAMALIAWIAVVGLSSGKTILAPRPAEDAVIPDALEPAEAAVAP